MTTTAIIFPLMSRTVPCKTNSEMERQRLPVVQFEAGPVAPAARMGLTNGSLRPLAPAGRKDGFFSAGGGAASTILGDAVLPGALVVLAALSIAAPAVSAQTPPSATQPGGVEKTITINSQGNVVVTERTVLNGQLIREEVTVTTRAGALVSKTETVFNPGTGQIAKRETVNVSGNTVTKTEQKFANGQLVKGETTVTTAGQLVSKTETAFNPATGQAVKRETVTVSGNTVTKTEERLVNGQVVKREIETVAISNGQRVTTEREFQLVNGQLVEVKHEQKVEEAEKVEDVKNKVKEVEKKEVEVEKKEVEKVEHENEGGGDHGGDSGHDGKGH